MSRKCFVIAGIVLLCAALTACHKESHGPAKGRQENSVTSSENESGTASGVARGNAQGNSSDSHDISGKNKDFDSSKEPAGTASPAASDKAEGDSMQANGQNLSDKFYYEEIPEDVKKRITGKSYGKNCDVPYEELRYVRVLYWGFDEETHDGELIVNKAIAEDITDIFKELYEKKYPIERMVLVDEYDADDNTSMAADNTSAFNYRRVDGTDHLSLHSYGQAIDINPLYNPYVRGTQDKKIITPVNGAKYADRSLDCPYYIKKGDICYETFIKHGFTWGGEWKSQKDYQHFQKTDK